MHTRAINQALQTQALEVIKATVGSQMSALCVYRCPGSTPTGNLDLSNFLIAVSEAVSKLLRFGIFDGLEID